MNENQSSNSEKQGSDVILSADETSETTTTKNQSKTVLKKPKTKILPMILILLVPAVIIAICLILGQGASKTSTTPTNNIDESAINWGTYSGSTIELSSSLKITSGGIYTLSGTIADGLIEIDTDKDVKLILNGVSVTNSNGPALYVANADNVIIETVAGTTNTFTDSSVYTNWDEDVCAAIFSHDDLVLQGEGKLVVNGNHEDGIVGKDDLKVSSGTIVISTKDDGLRGRDSVYIVDGNLQITSGGDAIKSNNSEEVAKGYILIDGGTLSLSASDDGIHAETSLEINGGTISVKKSYEGLEAGKITVNGGDISIVASDDGLNAAGGNDASSPNSARYQTSSGSYSININGGSIYVDSAGDGIDSNGIIYFNGGKVVVDGPANSANGAIDADGGVIYNGGTVIAVGGSGMAVAPNASSSKYSISVFFSQTYSAGTTLSVQDSAENTILTHTSARTFSHASLSSESFKEGETYTVLINGSAYTTVTLSGKTTQISSGMGGGMMEQGPSGPAGQGGARRF